MESLAHASVFAKLTLLLGLAPMAMAVAYAVRPSERRLALMRPLSLAAIFGALCALLLGVVNVLMGLGATGDQVAWHFATVGLAEALVVPMVTFAFLTVAWIAVAFGMRRGDRV
jgi:hypothetical protein